jgi:hypothetical protein
METEKVCVRCQKRCVPAQSYCPKCGDSLPEATPVAQAMAAVSARPELVPLTDDERDAAERDLMTSEVWRETVGYDPNTADHLLPPGAIRIPLIEYAAEVGKVYAVKVALNRGGDPNQTSSCYGSVLHAAARNGHAPKLRLSVPPHRPHQARRDGCPQEAMGQICITQI